VVDEGLAFFDFDVALEQGVNQFVRVGVDGVEDVRGVVKQKAVDLFGAAQASNFVEFFVNLVVTLEVVAGAQAGQAAAENEVFGVFHGSSVPLLSRHQL
jgi:hypothetical protein